MGYKEWNKIKWGEISELKYGKSLKGYKEQTKGIKVFGTNGPIGYTKNALAKGPSVIIGRKGAYRGVHYTNESFYVIDTAFYLVPKINMNMKWAYYELLLKDINSMDSGSAIPSTSRDDFYSLESYIPPINVQNKMVEFLDLIESKIENNVSIINRLEKVVQVVFKRWFIDYEFPNEQCLPFHSSGGEMIESDLGEIPKNWSITKLKEVMNIKSGYAFKSKWWQSSGIPVLKIKDITSNGINFNDLSFVDEDKKKYASSFIVRGGEVVLALTGATAGKMSIIPKLDGELLINQRVGLVKPVNDDDILENMPFIYALLKSKRLNNLIKEFALGSAQPNISPVALGEIDIILPETKNIINNYNEKINPIYQMILNKQYENEKLINIRNKLLPKILSGEIEIPDESVVES